MVRRRSHAKGRMRGDKVTCVLRISDGDKELRPHINGEYFLVLRDGVELKLSRNYKRQAQIFSGQRLNDSHTARLIGSWRLQRYKVLVGGEPQPSILGPTPQGFLIYADDGCMSAVMMASSREILNAPSLLAADDAGALAAARSCIAYAGRFEVHGDQVQHHVEVSLLPDWVGETLVRSIRWRDGALILVPPNEMSSSGKTIVRELTWVSAGGRL